MRAQEFITEDWNKVNKHDHTDGLSKKAVNAYRREHPGSKLKTAVTTKPSKLKKGSKSAKRRKSFCARMSGMKKHRAGAKTKRDPNSPINKALRRWHCESIEEMQELIMLGENYIAGLKQQLNEDGKRCMQCGMINCKCPGNSCKCKPIKGWIPGKGFEKAMKEAGSPAQQAAIAINMKKAGKKPKHASK